MESPTYMQLSNVYYNSLTSAQKNLIPKQLPHYDLNPGAQLANELTSQFCSKPNYILKKSLRTSNENSRNNQRSSSLTPIHPKIKHAEGSYLKNFNEYNIRESYHIDEDRMVNLSKKPATDFNCVSNLKCNFSPTAEIKVEKWPLFYENYYSLIKDDQNAFHKREGLFTNLLDQKLVGRNIQASNLRDNSKRKTIFPDGQSTAQFLNSQNNLSSDALFSSRDKEESKSLSPFKNRAKESKLNLEKMGTLSPSYPQSKFDYLIKARQIVEDNNLYKLKSLLNKGYSPKTNAI
jgi:hypothetical protein